MRPSKSKKGLVKNLTARSRNFSSVGFFLGCGILFFNHLIFLSQVPGLHYDEAWAGNFAHRIAADPGFWPLQAMSPYTSAWSHAWAALFFKIFGTSVFSYRLAGVLLAIGGILLLSRALYIIGEKRAASFFPGVAGLIPALLVNHRFGIEITTFHVFCFGLLGWSLAIWVTTKDRKFAAFFGLGLAVLLGVTSHILFLAVVLALWMVTLKSIRGPNRFAVAALAPHP